MTRSKGIEQKQFRKGEYLYKSGDPADRLYVLQQGLVSIEVIKNGKAFELLKATQPQIIGEEVLENTSHYSSTAIALNDTTTLIIPANEIQTIVNNSTPLIKIITKGMLARKKSIESESVTLKAGEDSQPCPIYRATKLFSVIYLVASYTGTKKNNAIVVSWHGFRRYCQRVFLESPIRLEQAIWMLASINLVKIEMVKNETDEEAPEEMGFIHFLDLDKIKGFSEYSRIHIYPGDLEKIKLSNSSEENLYSDILSEIEYWNRSGRPKGMPAIEEAENKYAQKKKAS